MWAASRKSWSRPPNFAGVEQSSISNSELLLCANPASGTCKTIGTATATSPLYPVPLTGTDYLTGTLSALKIVIVFPPPFALTLAGAVDVPHNTTTFTGLPDIPLSDLKVTLAGGKNAAFSPWFS